MKTTKEIQEKLSSKFNNLKLLEEYKGANEKIKIKCTNCGYIWYAIPRSVIKSVCGCPHCGVHKSLFKQAKERFLKKLDQNKFELIDYKDWKNVTVKCKICGHIRKTTADNIIRFGCKVCKSIESNSDRKLTQEEFIKRANIIHGNKYNYPNNYVNCKTKIGIICPIHGLFYQTPGKHLSGQNCPHCSESRGEELVRLSLIESNIPFSQEKVLFIPQKIFADFYILYNDKTYIIEINGRQHYEEVSFFGGKDQLNKQIQRDQNLETYCLNHNIQLFIIKYNDNFLEKIVEIIKIITAVY